MAGTPQQKNLDKLWEKIKGIEFAMLTTIDARDGCLRSRPMATASHDVDDGNVWFFSRADSTKMDDIQTAGKVNLTYVRPSTSTFVSLSGSGEVVRDKQLAKQLWSPLMAAYFKKGPEDPELALLKVKVEKVELWDVTSGAMDYIAHALTSEKLTDVTSHGVHKQFNVAEQPS